MKNLVLIGMPGSGKSTIGVLLAKAIGLPFIDTDIVIQQMEGKLLQDIINVGGIESFLSIEEKTLLALNLENYVVATGGSVVYSNNAMNHLRKNSLLVFLHLKYPEIESRIKNITTRGIAMERGQTLFDLYKERLPLYESYTDVKIDCSGKETEEIVSDIVTVYTSMKTHHT